ncbi:hypothetical protein VF21_00450 [Pseudogymnoascus sp. 05NY08]|nr:hypothetical protein VF21_00450 [Pseudogymnoascus sp. 05NY08]
MDTEKVKLPEKQKQVAGPSWTPQGKLHPDLHRREIATASTPRERAEQSDGSEAHQQCWRSRVEVEVPKSRSAEIQDEAGRWHLKTGSREGASNEPKPGSNLETEAEKRHLTAMPEASSNRGHRRRDTKPRPDGAES